MTRRKFLERGPVSEAKGKQSRYEKKSAEKKDA